MIVLDGISGHDHIHAFQTRHGAQHGKLHIDGKRRADTVRIDQVGVEPFGFEENLVAITIREAMDLVLDRRTIARPLRVDRATEKRRTVEIGGNHIMRLAVRAGDCAEYLRVHALACQRRHRPGFAIRSLFFQRRPIDSPPIEPRRCSSLQAREWQLGCPHLLRQLVRRCLADTPAFEPLFAAIQSSAQKRARAKDDSLGAHFRAVRQSYPAHRLAREKKLRYFSFDDGEIRLRRQHLLHCGAEQIAIRLDTRALYRASLAAIEHPIVDRCGVGSASQQPVECIDFAYEMSLAETTDGRVAAHCADLCGIECHQRRGHAHARCHGCSFAPGVAAADNDDLELRHQELS